MARILHFALFVLSFSVALGVLGARIAYAQDTNTTTVASPPAPSALPPIFAPGNHLIIVSRSYTGPMFVREVRGEWVFATMPGQNNPVWVRPASMEATWQINP
jgi:hypothetical protein